MEKTYIVAFESKLKTNVLISHLKAFGTWAKITNNTWAVVTSKTASQIRDELGEIVDTGDRVFVVKSGVEAAWLNTHASNDWLKRQL